MLPLLSPCSTSRSDFPIGLDPGIASVFCTYPLELIRVRMAYQTNPNERASLVQAVKLIYNEIPAPKTSPSSLASSASASTLRPSPPPPPIPSSSSVAAANSLTGRAFHFFPLAPFYRGFTVTILGIIPYAGISFLTYGNLKSLFPEAYYKQHRTTVDLACGGLAGLTAQSVSYPFEVVRRRMQVGGVVRPSGLLSWRETVKSIWRQGGWRGFYVGLGIGWLKVIPMNRYAYHSELRSPSRCH